MDKLSYLSNADASYIDSLYQSYLQDPESIDYGWRKFFEGFDFGQKNGDTAFTGGFSQNSEKESNVMNLILGYRSRGHLFTKTNPVRKRRTYFPDLALKNFDLSDEDLDTVFQAGNEVGLGPATLREIRQMLEETYCQSIGAEYMFIRNPDKIKFLQARIEASRNTPNLSLDTKKRILEKLNQAVVFESFLGTKFLGQKRFSLEGAENLIPALDYVIEKGSEVGIDEFVIGMAHRGRLNVLANIMNKTYDEIFAEFEGKGYKEGQPYGGDVKYHLGYSTDVTTKSGKQVHLSLVPNPSHLEAVDPVVEGISRAKIDVKYKNDYKKLAPILIHGDASISGQGIVYEVLQMSRLEGYKTGGTIHLVINNQVGFTTNYLDGRSSIYCTDIAKTTQSPIFHVNGDDAEALIYAISVALEYRQKYHLDVFIDILCYRRYGHNEADEPKFTQPLLYKAIEEHPNPREIYNRKLLAQGSVDADLAREMEKEFRKLLQEELDESRGPKDYTPKPKFSGAWSGLRMATSSDFEVNPDTSVSNEVLNEVATKLTTLPADKKIFRKIEKLFADRRNMIETKGFDWAMGELMAYGTLLEDGFSVRVSGEDVKRGTFSHRHAVITLQESEEEYIPLHLINKENPDARFEIYNSHLSEYGVLGFEYGYALANPKTLTIWEAQFGDFANGAQIIIDQYLVSAETKWQRANGIVLLLPHGYEGQGPEHSSARIERFLTLCANDNMQVANCTTPANFFHLLRRQLHRDFRKPLVVFTPKSLLRNPKCVSRLEEFTGNSFMEIIDDANVSEKNVKRVLLCSGKVYYDLLEKQEKDECKHIALVRMEQLYPLPLAQLKVLRSKYSRAREWVWVQEEPENMGPWPFVSRKLGGYGFDLKVIARPEDSSTATGYAKQHIAEQLSIVSRSFEEWAGSDVKEKVVNETTEATKVD